MKMKKGITLIALVITIIIMLILASVVISLSIGSNGLFNRAKYAQEKYLNEYEKEQIELAKLKNLLGADNGKVADTEIDTDIESTRDTDETYTELLPETNVTMGEPYTLSDSIYNYKKILIYGIVQYEDEKVRMMASNIMLTRDIEIDDEYITQVQFPVFSNPDYYSAFHIQFTQENEIYLNDLNENQWGAQAKLKIYGIN